MRALAMLRRGPIAMLWTGQCLSAMGDYFYFVALMWTAAKLTGNTAGVVAAAESWAALSVAALGGVIADRVDRRRAMIVADLGRAAAVGGLALFALRGALGVAPLVVTALVLGCFDALFNPALLASLPALCTAGRTDAEPSPGELQATNGLMDATRRIARAVGPSLAGAVATVVPIAQFFVLDAASFAASAAAIYALGPRLAWKVDRGANTSRGVRSVFGDVAEGLRLVGGHPRAAWALASVFLVNTTWAAGFQVGAVLLASGPLSTALTGYAFLVGSYGAGNVVGNLVVGNIHVERKTTLIATSMVVLGTGFLLLAWAPSLPVAMLGASLAAIGGPMGGLPLISLLQSEFPSNRAGRIFSLRFMTEHAGVTTGLLLATPLYAFASVRVGISTCALTLVAGGAAMFARFGTRT
ncbi:MAG TPA: MFS transporter [Polyangiaceae bacterium]|jgi:MFS family permease